jgi:hypothetical protein
MDMPTTEQLKKQLGYQSNSIAYGNSRTIIKHMDEPVVAYAIGANCLVIVIQDGHKRLIAYSYAAKFPFNNYNYAGFAQLPINKALEIIRTNTNFTKKQIDNEKIKDVVERYERPTLAEFEILITSKYGHEFKNSFRAVQLKNGKVIAQGNYYGNSYRKITEECFLQEWKNRNKKDGYNEKSYNGNVKSDIIERLQNQIMINKL